jgi:DNA-binding response OmpR family regulator
MLEQILIVDDTQEVLDIVQLILDMKGYSTLTAKSGAECLEILNKQHVDLILLDIIMPEIDGWEVLRQLKIQGETGAIPIVILSAKTQSIDKMLGLKVFGASDYLTKPFTTDDLLEKISKVLGESY